MKKENTSEDKNVLLNIYLAVIVAISLLSIGFELYTKHKIISNELENLTFTIATAGFLLSIYCYIYFKKQRFSKLTLVLPLLNVVLFLSLFILGMAIGLLSLFYGKNLYALLNSDLLSNLSILENTFQIVFALYILIIHKR